LRDLSLSAYPSNFLEGDGHLPSGSWGRETLQLLPVHDWPAIWRQGLVQGVETEELFASVGKERMQIGVTRKVKLSDRVKRLELIGKHIGVNAFQEAVNVKGVDGWLIAWSAPCAGWVRRNDT
jgi:hypothetical protein